MHKYIAKWNINNFGKTISRGDKMTVETDTTVNSPTTVEDRSYHRIFSLVGFVYGLLRSVGIFLFGIFLGLGIVLRDPPKDKQSLEMISKLQQENESLKLSLKQQDDSKPPVFGEIKNSIVIGK